MSAVESNLNPFDYQEKELVNIIENEIAEKSVEKSILSAEENGVKAIEIFVAGPPNAFSKVKVAAMANSLKKGYGHKKKTFNSIQEELEVTRTRSRN